MSTVAERPKTKTLGERTSADLRRELKGLIDNTVANLQRMAIIVAELERRGEDLSGLRLSLLPSLRRIAAGQMLAEIVLQFADRPLLMKSLGGLPIADQKRLIASGTVDVLVDGNTQPVKLLALPFSTISQVFSPDHIRTPEEQRVYLAGQKNRERTTDEPKRHFRVRADRERGGVWIGQAFVKLAEIVPALAELAGPLELLIPDDAETVTVRVTKAEKEKLRLLSNQRKLPDWHLLREAIHANGLI